VVMTERRVTVAAAVPAQPILTNVQGTVRGTDLRVGTLLSRAGTGCYTLAVMARDVTHWL
jgi:hypothetical protein